MIFHETCDVVTKVAGPDDAYGNPRYTYVHTPSRCEMTPLFGSETVDPTVDQVRTRYRSFLPAGTAITPSAQIGWRGVTYEVQGSIERHVRHGRVQHLECIAVYFSG